MVFAKWDIHWSAKTYQKPTWKQGLWGQNGAIWGRHDPGGPHVGPINFAIWAAILEENKKLKISDLLGYPRPIGEGGNGQWVDCNLTLFKITRRAFWKRHSWQSLGFCLQPQRTCTWNLKLIFQSKLELRCWNHAIQKPKNLIRPPGSHLENEVTENQ